jgi:flagellin-specific chaperone FliS
LNYSIEKEFLEEIVKTRNNLKYKNIKPSNQKLDMIINIVEELKNS